MANQEIENPSSRVRFSERLVAPAFFFAAVAISLAFSFFLVRLVEQEGLKRIDPILGQKELSWLSAEADGLLITLRGEAPGNFEQRKAQISVHSALSGFTVIDGTTAAEEPEPIPPSYSFRLVPDGGRVQLFGELPNAGSAQRITAALNASGRARMVENRSILRNDEEGDNWRRAFEFGLLAIELLPDASLHLTETSATLSGRLDSQRKLARIQAEIYAALPDTLELNLALSAPEPFLSPYLFDVQVEDSQLMIAECHAETAQGRNRIETELAVLGNLGSGYCGLAQGAPSADWTDAVLASIALLRAAPIGRIRIENLDLFVWLNASGRGSAESGRLTAAMEALPDQFNLNFVGRKEIENRAAGGAPSTAIRIRLTPDRRVEVSGIADEDNTALMIANFAALGLEPAELTNRLEIDAVTGIPISDQVVVGIDALSMLEFGTLTLGNQSLEVSGKSQSPAIEEEMEAFLSERLGAENYAVDVQHDPALSEQQPPMEPSQCVANANAVVSERKIPFEPGSTQIGASAFPTLQDLAKLLTECTHARIEIAGHTDNQGREEMNLRLSTKRAESVLEALLDAGVLTQNFTAVGYGESQPIADNATQEGRKTNRRIEFRLYDGLNFPGSR